MSGGRLRVAIGSVFPYDEIRVRGGVEAVCLSLVRALARRGDLELHVVTCNPRLQSSCTERRGAATFHWLATGPRLYNLRALTVNAWRVRQVYERIQPQVIHAENGSEYALGAPGGVPLVLTVHGLELLAPAMRRSAQFRGPIGWYRRATGRWILERSVRKSNAVISIAGDYVPRFLGRMLGGKPVHCIPNPIADDAWPEVRHEGDPEPLVLCVGDIIERKNALGLVRAFAELRHRVPAARLCLAGGTSEPAYLARVQEEIGKLGLQAQVELPGRLDQARLRATYARAAVVAQASIQETAPMAVAEAMTFGKPVVATRAGGTAALVQEGVTGHLVDVGDMRHLADRLEELLLDEGRRQSLGRAAREAAERQFSAAIVAARTVEVYRSLLPDP